MDSYFTIKGLHFVFLQNRSKIEFFLLLPVVSYPGESVFSQLKIEYLGENETKYENILTHWSVAQAGRNEEKTRGRKSRWTVPLRKKLVLVRNQARNKKLVLVYCSEMIVA